MASLRLLIYLDELGMNVVYKCLSEEYLLSVFSVSSSLPHTTTITWNSPAYSCPSHSGRLSLSSSPSSSTVTTTDMPGSCFSAPLSVISTASSSPSSSTQSAGPPLSLTTRTFTNGTIIASSNTAMPTIRVISSNTNISSFRLLSSNLMIFLLNLCKVLRGVALRKHPAIILRSHDFAIGSG